MLKFIKEILWFLLSFLIISTLILIRKTCKIENFLNDYNETIDKNRPVFYFLWHRCGTSTASYFPFYTKFHNSYVTLSQNKSTKIMRFAFKFLGCKIIDGSKHKGYLGSIREIIRVLQVDKKALIAVTPDGPRGPEFQIPDEALFKIIKKNNAQIRFICPISNSIWETKTWDKVYVIKPFSKVFFIDKQILTDNEIENLDTKKLASLCEERMFSWFLKAREICELPSVAKGAVKRKRPNSGNDRI